jgi:hypothetical protein
MYTDGLLESLTPRLEPEEFLGVSTTWCVVARP